MALVECKECGEEISVQAKTCPLCGARRTSSPLKKALVTVAVLVIALLVFGFFQTPGNGAAGSFTKQDVCDQSSEAAHYIAAMSSSPSEVSDITRQVIAQRKFPALDDKLLASIGMVVILSQNTKTPDELAQTVRETCENPRAPK